jgi:hypothetical protein
MSLQEMQEQIVKLSRSDRLALVNLIIKSLQSDSEKQLQQTESFIPSSSLRANTSEKRTALISKMRGFLKTDKPTPTDDQVQAMLEELQ